jgi:2-oxoglutarate/2-oxoacid ferredoxin oxidoreductase subunit beta
MTGGQMAPTTMPGQISTTCPEGRDAASAGFPIRMVELLATLRTPAFVARGSVHTPLHVVATKQLLRRAFACQHENQSFALVEILSTCPTNWGLTPNESLAWLDKNMVPFYPLGVFKTPDGADRAPLPLPSPSPSSVSPSPSPSPPPRSPPYPSAAANPGSHSSR